MDGVSQILVLPTSCGYASFVGHAYRSHGTLSKEIGRCTSHLSTLVLMFEFTSAKRT